VPVEFLTDEQAEAYGTFTEVPTRPELERFFFLDDDDRDLIALLRGRRDGPAYPGAGPLALAERLGRDVDRADRYARRADELRETLAAVRAGRQAAAARAAVLVARGLLLVRPW
jgi:hypothetical protein